jgi:DNA repair protein RecN (Recombination protein N)
MLDELHVRDYALVRDARLAFPPGCTALTGETGAGKTALVGALKLLIGERGDATSVRDGARELVVEGRVITQGEEHVATRRLTSDGRSRCTLDDGMVTVGTLAERLGPLVELHGQHEHQSLLSPATQLSYLDRYAGDEGYRAFEEYQRAWDAWRDAEDALVELRQAARTSTYALEEARRVVGEMEATSPRPGEYEELERQLPILRNGEALALASQTALEALRGTDARPGALDALAGAHRALGAEAGTDARLDDLAAQLESLAITADDLAASLRSYHEQADFDPQALEAALDRLGALEGLRKRYGPRMDDVFTAWQEASQQLLLTEDLGERLQAAEQTCVSSAEALKAAGAALAKLRAYAAERLAEELSRSLRDLAMEGVSVAFAIRELPRASWTRNGTAHYELTFCPSAASVPRPLAKIASGGELSRVMLALKTLQGTLDERVTLVFDEVDAGIGGVTATAVAERLRTLSTNQQVIVVTHLAQIAAVADRQFVVEKALDGAEAVTTIREVTGEERVAEVARMLAGSTDEVARGHARRLLESAGVL